MPLVKSLATQDKTQETPVNCIGGNVDDFALEKLIEDELLLYTLSQDHEVWLEQTCFSL